MAETLLEFWTANRTEIVVTALIVVIIQLIAGAGGANTRKASMKRIPRPERPDR